jgi:adenine specific DNA methylase Mod
LNYLYFGDNLEILKENISDSSIDLIYIDPPFNSKRNYNVLFESVDLSDVKAQKQAFADTWSNVSYKDELNEILDLNKDLYDLLKALDKINISTSAVSYLTTMALRIYYMHKKLKQQESVEHIYKSFVKILVLFI